MNTIRKLTIAKTGFILFLSLTLTACAVAPSQSIGYRMTDSVLPTYVNGQYVGMQASDYVAPDIATTPIQPPPTFSSSPITTYSPPTITQSSTVYMPSPVYVPTPAPVYYSSYYNPYYYPSYVSPWYTPGISVGIGLGLGYRHGCCWGGWGRGRYWRH